MHSLPILGVNIHTTSYSDAVQKIINWAKAGESRMVCAANVHMVMEAYDNPGFKAILNKADLVTPDGMPLVWMLRRMGAHNQKRVYGPDLMLHVLSAVKDAGIPVGFYGGKPEVLQVLVEKMQEQFPGLQVVYTCSPPFTPKSQGEGERVISEINLAKPRILFIARRRGTGDFRDKFGKAPNFIYSPGLPQTGALDGTASRKSRRGDAGRGGGF